MACDPSGFSGPGRTTRGRSSPRAAYSSRIVSVGYQAGPTFFLTTLVLPSGVSYSSRPMPMGQVRTRPPSFG